MAKSNVSNPKTSNSTPAAPVTLKNTEESNVVLTKSPNKIVKKPDVVMKEQNVSSELNMKNMMNKN